MGRRCTVHLCESSSSRLEDQGVTFHKLPVNEHIKLIWLAQCHLPLDARYRTVYVCSRHFRRVDFQTFKGTKYMLKTGAIPSMFAWGRTTDEELEKMCLQAFEPKTSNRAVKLSENIVELSDSTENVANSTSNNNVNRIECDRTKENNSDRLNLDNCTPNSAASKAKSKRTAALNALKHTKKTKLPESAALEEKGSLKKTSQMKHLQSRTPKEKNKPDGINGNSSEPRFDLAAMNLVPGSRVEAKDFNDQWTTATVMEVDNDENEILIEFEKWSKKSDEWIPMNSSRLRPIDMPLNTANRMFQEGERCMARWTDSRKFPATIRKLLENDNYEVLFDDGYIKTVQEAHISRLPGKLKGPPMIKTLNTPNNKTNTPNTTNTPVARRIPEKSPNNKIEQEWCFRWEGDSPVGRPGSIDAADGVKRTTVIVDDPRLPAGWIKHVVKRYTGSSAGKWDIVIVNPNNRKFRTKKEIDTYFLESGKSYNPDNFDFSLHRKRAKEIGWVTTPPTATPIKRKRTSTGESKNKITTPKLDAAIRVPACPSTPVQGNNLEDGFVHVGSLKVQIIDNLFRCPEVTCCKNFRKENLLQMHIKHYHPHLTQFLGSTPNVADLAYARTIRETTTEPEPIAKNRYSNSQFYEKVAKIDAIHKRIKSIVSPSPVDIMPMSQIKTEPPDESILNDADINVFESPSVLETEFKIPKLEKTPKIEKLEVKPIINFENNLEPPKPFKSESNCPLLEEALRVDTPKRNLKHHVTFDPDKTVVHHYKEPPDVQEIPGSGIKRLLPKKMEENITEQIEDNVRPRKSIYKRRGGDPPPMVEPKLNRKLHKRGRRKKHERNRVINHDLSYEQDENLGINSIDSKVKAKNNVRNMKIERPGSEEILDVVNIKPEFPDQNIGTPVAPESSSPVYITEDGEKIKLVRMRREEIINCGCGYPEEDGLMMQCELCLCWQHANCLGIQKESEVPERYVCAICSTPRAARPSKRYINNQEWLMEGKLPNLIEETEVKDLPFQDYTKVIHEATGNVLEMMPVVKSLRAKIAMATQTDHPKFYYWAKPWRKYEDRTMGPPSTSTSSTNATHSKCGSEMISPTLQAIHNDLISSSENESEILGAQIENEMNLLKSKTKTKNTPENCVSTTFPTQETPSRGLNIYTESKDDFASLVKGDVFDANVDISAILETNDAIPTDSELVSILEGDLKSENDLNSPVRLKNGTANIYNSETETDDDCKNDLNMDLLSYMAADDKASPCKSAKSIKSTTGGDLDSPSLLAPLLASPGGTKFDLVSDRELEKFAESVGQQVLINTHPVPEEAIDNEQCRWNLLRHIDDEQNDLESQLDQLNNRLENLMQLPEAPNLDSWENTDENCSRLIKLMQRDLKILEDTCSMSIDLENSKIAKQNQAQQIQDCSLTPTDVKKL